MPHRMKYLRKVSRLPRLKRPRPMKPATFGPQNPPRTIKRSPVGRKSIRAERRRGRRQRVPPLTGRSPKGLPDRRYLGRMKRGY